MSLGWVAAAAVVVVGAGIVAIVWAPWRSVREEHPLEPDVETRLLLGEDPAHLAEELDDEHPDEAPGRDA